MVYHLAPPYRPRPDEQLHVLAADEFDDQGFPSEDLDSEMLLPDAAFFNEDYGYEREAEQQDYADDARAYESDSASYYEPAGPAPSYTPSYGGGGGGGYYAPQPQYQPPPVAPATVLPTTTPAEVATFIAALQACTATQAQAEAAVTALTSIGMAAAAATIVSMYQAQAARCAASAAGASPPGSKTSVGSKTPVRDPRAGLDRSGAAPLPASKAGTAQQPSPPKSSPGSASPSQSGQPTRATPPAQPVQPSRPPRTVSRPRVARRPPGRL